MERVSRTMVRSGRPAPDVRCSLQDAVLQHSVAMAWVFEEDLDAQALAQSLAASLGEYPVFGGRLRRDGQGLHLCCDDPGVEFEVVRRRESLPQALQAFLGSERDKVVADVRAEGGWGGRDCLLHARLSHYAGGGSVLGVCWHHSVGDMHSFMRFMHDWSNRTAGRPTQSPWLLQDRLEFTSQRMVDREANPEIRLIGRAEYARWGLFLARHARSMTKLAWHFTDEELARLREAQQQHSARRISRNDALSAHIVSLLNRADPREQPRKLTATTNWRRKRDLPDTLIGNFIGTFDIECETGGAAEVFAQRLRAALQAYEPNHRTFTRVVERAGLKHHARILAAGIDTLRGSLTLPCEAGFGGYDIDFGSQGPSYFCPMFPSIVPWFGMICEGYGNSGRQVTLSVPGPIAQRLRSDELRGMAHRHRPTDSTAADPKLPWML